MQKRKVLIVVHQLNFGGVQKSLIPALDAIDYNENDVTLYVRKNRTDLLPLVNKNVSKIIVNNDKTHYYRKPYSLLLLARMKIRKLLKMDIEPINNKLKLYVLKKQMEYEKEHNFYKHDKFDVAISFIQGYTALFVNKCINADSKIMFYRDSTDENHQIHEQIMPSYDSIYCVSCGARDALKGFYPQHSDKIDFIDTFVVSDEIIKSSNSFTVEHPDDRLVLCTCGRFTKVKGLDLAIDAAILLKKHNIRFLWYFVGDGQERDNLERKIVENNLSEEIVITGMKDNPYPYIKCCDIYVQPSREESFGRTIKEAMILDKPIVSTKTIGGIEQIKDGRNGVLADISGESIAKGIELLVNDSKLKESIICELVKIDYSKEFEDYKLKWKKLLEG